MAGDGMKERAANMQQRRVLEIGVATPQSFDHCVDEYGNVAIVVSRQEVEGCATGRVVAALMALTDTPQRVRRFANALWLSFDGYNDDARELWEIPEVVRYFAAVHASWPHWCHFMVKEPVAFSLVLTLLLQRAGLAGRWHLPAVGGQHRHAQGPAVRTVRNHEHTLRGPRLQHRGEQGDDGSRDRGGNGRPQPGMTAPRARRRNGRLSAPRAKTIWPLVQANSAVDRSTSARLGGVADVVMRRI